MSKKRPRSKDPHSWIKDTTKKAEEPKPSGQADETKPAENPEASEATDETPAGEMEETAAHEATPQRFIIVEYDKNDGHIIAIHEMMSETRKSAGEDPDSVPKGMAATRIALTGELSDKTLMDIHENYKVVISKTKPTLVPRD
jgi:hypothetical protein